jgi:hypothetical protein
METKRKTVYRLSELDELKRRLQEPLTFQERERRRRIFARMDQLRESMAIIPGDVKDWIRADRGECSDG